MTVHAAPIRSDTVPPNAEVHASAEQRALAGNPLREACHLAGRDIRALLRQPWYVAVTLFQPVIWLVLFGQMFGRFADFPGFGAPSYVDYLTPGVVVMTALYSNGWAGMSYILDMEGGVLDRLLITPVSRGR